MERTIIDFSSMNDVLPANVTCTSSRIVEFLFEAPTVDLEGHVALRCITNAGTMADANPVFITDVATDTAWVRFEVDSALTPIALIFTGLTGYDTASIKVEGYSPTGASSITDGNGTLSFLGVQRQGYEIDFGYVNLV